MSRRAARIFSTTVFVATVAVLATARWLNPEPSGLGTHTQLGLEPCISMTVLRLPCPLCGMTTTFSLMADFRLLDAFLNQPLGTVLFMVTALSAIVAGLEIASPQKRWLTIIDLLESHKAAFIAVFSSLFFGSWLYKIALVREMFTTIP